jgi:hypothetical protein
LPHTSSEVTKHVVTVPLPGIGAVHIAIKSEGVLGCIGYTVGVIEEIMDGMPPCVDLRTLRENYSEKAQSGKRYFKITPQSPSTGGTWSSSPVSKTGPGELQARGRR